MIIIIMIGTFFSQRSNSYWSSKMEKKMRPSFQCPKIECMNKSVPRETKPNKRWHFWMNSRKKRAMEITLIQNRDRKKCSMKKNLFTCNRRFKNQWIRSKRNHWSLFLTCWFIWIGYNSKIPKRPWRLSIISINDC